MKRDSDGVPACCPEQPADKLTEIRELLSRSDAVILDTETTGHKHAEVIEVSIIDMAGNVLFDRLIRPRRMVMNRYAQRVHGISLSMLAAEPTLPELLPELNEILDCSLVLAWNASFDNLMLQRSRAIWDLEPREFDHQCAMRLYAGLRGQRDFGLHRAVREHGLEHLLELHESHRALGDVNLVLELLKTVAVSEDDPLLVSLP